jgi:TatD DNase family protein
MSGSLGGAVLVDTHAHLHDDAFAADRDAVLARARAAGVGRLVTIGTDAESSRAAAALAERHADVYAAVGIHPHDASRADEIALAEVTALARHPRVVAVGEIGLDYFRNLSPRRAQLDALRAQLALAREVRKPVLLHCRDAHAELLEVLAVEGLPERGGIMHCFSGDVAVARRCLDLGLVLSIAGPVTYPNARGLPDVVRLAPADWLVVETDCPYLPPQPWRGQRNEPSYLATTAARVAELRGTDLAALAADTTRNASRCLAIPVPGAPDSRLGGAA